MQGPQNYPPSGFPGPSPGTPTGGPSQLVSCGPSSGTQSQGGFPGSPADHSGSSTPGIPISSSGHTMVSQSSMIGGNGHMSPMMTGPGMSPGCPTQSHCNMSNNFGGSNQYNGLGPPPPPPPCGPCIPNSPGNCIPPTSSHHLRGQSPHRPGSSGPPYTSNSGSPFPPFGPSGPPPPGVLGPPSQMPGQPSQFLGPPGPHSFGPPPPSSGMHPGMSPHGPPMGPHGHGPPHFMERMEPGFGMMSRRPVPLPQPDYRIYEMNKRLQQRSDESDNLWWDAFATEFFEDEATLTLTFCLEDGPKRYSIGRTLIPRYFRSIFEGGVTDLRYELRYAKESFHNSSITLDCDQCTVVTLHGKPMFTKVYTEGRLIVEFTFDDMMRIRSWHFSIRTHRELIPRSLVSMQEPGVVENLAKNITRQGLTSTTLNYLRLCVILEPMQELMSRHKAYALNPRDCLKTTLFQKWQKMVAPPGKETSRPSKQRRKRKGPTGPASQSASLKKRSPGPNFSLASQDVMVVGEPSLMGGDFGEEDERLISRLENSQYDPAAGPAQPGGPGGMPGMPPGGPMEGYGPIPSSMSGGTGWGGNNMNSNMSGNAGGGPGGGPGGGGTGPNNGGKNEIDPKKSPQNR